MTETAKHIRIHNWEIVHSFTKIKTNTFVYLLHKQKSYNLSYNLLRMENVQLGPIAAYEVYEPASNCKVGYCFELAYCTSYAYNYLMVCRPMYKAKDVDGLRRAASFVQLKYRLDNLRVYEYQDTAYGVFAYSERSRVARHLNRVD